MRVLVVSVGRLRAPYADDVAHYEKLLSRYVRLELLELRDPGHVARRLPAASHTCLLAADGAARDSPGLARWIEARRASGRDLTFVIGGSHGLELDRVDSRLSLGPLTLAHQLARVVLLEQLYRAHKIITNEPYHH
ncbi:MAG: 23S rRNA (pseudouridine(1915)-N(3))-methyltransferase RlmH [Solirubrobacteraceae bacterium]